MFQITPRQSGRCVLCPEDTEVVALTKEGQTLKLCRKHLWEALKAAGNGTAHVPPLPAPGASK